MSAASVLLTSGCKKDGDTQSSTTTGSMATGSGMKGGMGMKGMGMKGMGMKGMGMKGMGMKGMGMKGMGMKGAMATGVGTATAAATDTASVPKLPTISLNSVVTGPIKTKSVKNWDGTFVKFLVFKHQLGNGKIILVNLPYSMKSDKFTKIAWNDVFIAYEVNDDVTVDAIEKNAVPTLDASTQQIQNDIMGNAAGSSQGFAAGGPRGGMGGGPRGGMGMKGGMMKGGMMKGGMGMKGGRR